MPTTPPTPTKASSIQGLLAVTPWARITTFLYGLTNEEVQRYLNDFGMSVQEIDVGWGLFQEAVRGTPQARRQLTNSQAARTLTELDRWENIWFPIAQASLMARHPEIGQLVFQDLSQASGKDVIITVQLFLDRLDELGQEGEAGEAIKLLEARGLTASERERARAYLESLKPSEIKEPSPEPIPREVLVERVWNWYREWVTIARVAIPRKDLRIILGISRRSPSGEELLETDLDEELGPELEAGAGNGSGAASGAVIASGTGSATAPGDAPQA